MAIYVMVYSSPQFFSCVLGIDWRKGRPVGIVGMKGRPVGIVGMRGRPVGIVERRGIGQLG